MRLRGTIRIAALVLVAVIAGCAAKNATPVAENGGVPQVSPDPWPRQIQLADAAVLVYQPQVESWQGDQLAFRCAVAATPNGSSDKVFGVIWGTARTQVDRNSRRVTLEDLVLSRSKFPTLADNGAAYLGELRQQPAPLQTISLDRLEASLAASGTVHTAGVAVKNAPPRIIVSYAPAILVPIDGQAVTRKVADSRFDRVINTRALIVRKRDGGNYYLHVYDGWLTAAAIDGPWTQASSTPMGIDEVAKSLKDQVDLLDGGSTQPKPSLAKGVPAVYVTHAPAELIVFKGQPNLQPISGTTLLWASNTTSDVIVDTADNDYYVLLSGRWYQAQSLNGPWTFVASSSLPPSFAQIPASSPAGVVLASVAGTPQAQEAVIENSIPQTATVPRSGGPSFTPTFDGAAKLRPIAGTSLQYVANSGTPIIRVDATTYYALSAGVWFSATSLGGPWMVADKIPEAIYSIPPSSALYFVTYVRVYGSTPDVVYVGYTPGYLGTVVAPDGTVVYGTGYAYDPWIGDVWYAPPATWGMEAQPVYNPAVGWAYGFGLGLTTAALVDTWDAPIYYGSVYRGYPCCGSVSANVYGQWGNTVTSGSRTWYDTSAGTVGTTASGTYANQRTGTTGTYDAGRSYNPYTGVAQQGYQRTANTTSGASGSVSRGERYDAETGVHSYGSSVSATGAGGSSVTRDTAAAAGPEGSAAAHETTVDNAKTGNTTTVGTAHVGNDHYADVNGNVYKNTGSGWQEHGSDGWQSAAGNTDWAKSEQQARTASDSRFGSFQNSFGGDRFGGDAGGWGDRFGGGGFGGRFGGGGFGGFRGGGFRR